jgi:hypothetical protein
MSHGALCMPVGMPSAPLLECGHCRWARRYSNGVDYAQLHIKHKKQTFIIITMGGTRWTTSIMHLQFNQDGCVAYYPAIAFGAPVTSP